jgi:hypothetical protein
MSNSDSQPGSSNNVHVRGARTYGMQAGAAIRLGATVLDGSLAVFLFFALHRALRLSPLPNPAWAVGCVSTLGLLWALGRLAFGRSPGEGAWRLRAAKSQLTSPLRASLLQPSRHSHPEIATGVILTVIAVIASAWSIDRAVFKQPLWARADALELEAFLPDMKSRRWEVLPFFYTLGAWPREYAGKPVLYSLPYE